jgi:hypothetical protein
MLALAAAHGGKNIAGNLVFLTDGEVEPVECDLKQFERRLMGIAEMVRSMDREEDFEPNPSCSDHRCVFRSRCRGRERQY